MGLGLCVVVNSCGDPDSSGGSESSAQNDELSPSVDLETLKGKLGELIDANNYFDNEEDKRKFIDSVFDSIKMYENASKYISKNFVLKVLVQNFQKVYLEIKPKQPEEASEKNIQKWDAKFQKAFKMKFLEVANITKDCAIAIHLFSKGKDEYSQEEDKGDLFDNILPFFAEEWIKNEGKMDKIKAVNIALSKLKKSQEAARIKSLEIIMNSVSKSENFAKENEQKISQIIEELEATKNCNNQEKLSKIESSLKNSKSLLSKIIHDNEESKVFLEQLIKEQKNPGSADQKNCDLASALFD